MFYASCILDVLLVLLIFYAFTLYLLLSISTSYWVAFDPCKDLLNVNKDEDGVVNFMPWPLYDRERIPVPIE